MSSVYLFWVAQYRLLLELKRSGPRVHFHLSIDVQYSLREDLSMCRRSGNRPGYFVFALSLIGLK